MLHRSDYFYRVFAALPLRPNKVVNVVSLGDFLICPNKLFHPKELFLFAVGLARLCAHSLFLQRAYTREREEFPSQLSVRVLPTPPIRYVLYLPAKNFAPAESDVVSYSLFVSVLGDEVTIVMLNNSPVHPKRNRNCF